MLLDFGTFSLKQTQESLENFLENRFAGLQDSLEKIVHQGSSKSYVAKSSNLM